MSLIDKIKKASGNEYIFSASDTSNPYAVEEWIDTGCYVLNAILSNGDIFKGLPVGKRVGFSGQSGSTKSLTSLFVCKSYLEQVPNSNLIVFETEGASILDMLDVVGIDKNRVVILPVKTVEQFKIEVTKILDMVKNDKKSDERYIFLLDSLGMLATTKEVEDAKDGKIVSDMTRAKIIRSVFRIITLDLSLLKIPLLIANHSYATMDMYSKQVSSGGGGLQYASDIILQFSKAQDKSSDGKRIGSIITLSTEKSRYVQDNKKVKLALAYGKGFYKYSYLLEYGIELGVIKKEGMSYVFPDEQKGTKKSIQNNPTQFYNESNLEIIKQAILSDMSLCAFDSNTDVDDIDENEVITDDEIDI